MCWPLWKMVSLSGWRRAFTHDIARRSHRAISARQAGVVIRHKEALFLLKTTQDATGPCCLFCRPTVLLVVVNIARLLTTWTWYLIAGNYYSRLHQGLLEISVTNGGVPVSRVSIGDIPVLLWLWLWLDTWDGCSRR